MQQVFRQPARFVLALTLCGVCSVFPIAALTSSATGQAPKLSAASAILMEAQTGKILYALHPDIPFPPASLTKMMTLELALDAIENGKLRWNQEVVPVKPAWDTSMPPRSSLMFLGPNQRLTVRTLLTGLIVDSGNDAAYEVAYLVAGSVPAFAKMMNEQAKSMGFPEMHFVEPSGLSSKNRITAKEYAQFCRAFIRLHPDSLANIFAVKKFTYPKPKNLTNGSKAKPIVQYNRNLLLWDYPGTDGFKTGYIDQSGYNMAVTAKRNGMRLIAVVLGVHGDGKISGIHLRAQEEERLLGYGFSNYTKVLPIYSKPGPIRIWKGASPFVTVEPYRTPAVVVPKSEKDKLKVTVEVDRNVLAPVYTGDTLGKLVFMLGNKKVREIPLVAQSNVARSGLPKRVFDSIVLFARGVFGLPAAKAASPPPPASASALAGAAAS